MGTCKEIPVIGRLVKIRAGGTEVCSRYLAYKMHINAVVLVKNLRNQSPEDRSC